MDGISKLANHWRIIVPAALVVTVALSSRLATQEDDSQLAPMEDGQARLVVDAKTTYQTMSGWEATAQAAQVDSKAFLAYRDQLFDLAVDDLGINRLRLEIRSGAENSSDHWTDFQAGRISSATFRGLRYATVNDNTDPFSLDERGFWFSEFDDTIEKVVLPIRQRLAERGRQLFINVNYVAFTSQIPADLGYHHKSAEEYAEFVQATYRHLISKYGFAPDSWEIQLEPDNKTNWEPAFMRQAIVAAGNRLEAMGVTPRLVAPSTTNMASAIDYGDAIAKGGKPKYWSALSYHRYSGVSDGTLRTIASRATQWGVETAMLEHIGSGYEDLHDDLKTGLNSAWQQFTLAYIGSNDNGDAYYRIDDSNPLAPRITMGARTAFLRQYFKYVRAGATRIGSNTSDGAFDPLAFVNTDGTYVVVVKATKGGPFTIQGLPAGAYLATYATDRDRGVVIGDFLVSADGALSTTIPDRGVLTISGAVPVSDN